MEVFRSNTANHSPFNRYGPLVGGKTSLLELGIEVVGHIDTDFLANLARTTGALSSLEERR